MRSFYYHKQTKTKMKMKSDENISNVSLDDNSVESVEQRHDMDNAATPASDSNHSDHNPLGGPSKHSTSSAGANLSDRESPGDLESNMEGKMHTSSSPYNREYEHAMSQKLMEKSDPQQDINIWKKQQDSGGLEREPEKRHGPTDPRDSGESQLIIEESEWPEDETSAQKRLSELGQRLR